MLHHTYATDKLLINRSWMLRDRQAAEISTSPGQFVTSTLTDVVEAAGCSVDTEFPRCRIVPTFSLAKGNVPVSPEPCKLAALSPGSGVAAAGELLDDERATTAASGERFSTRNEWVCFGGTGGGAVVRRGESPIDAVLTGLAVDIFAARSSAVPRALSSAPTDVKLDVPVPLLCSRRSVREQPALIISLPPPLLFDAVLEAKALAEFGRAQLL